MSSGPQWQVTLRDSSAACVWPSHTMLHAPIKTYPSVPRTPGVCPPPKVSLEHQPGAYKATDPMASFDVLMFHPEPLWDSSRLGNADGCQRSKAKGSGKSAQPRPPGGRSVLPILCCHRNISLRTTSCPLPLGISALERRKCYNPRRKRWGDRGAAAHPAQGRAGKAPGGIFTGVGRASRCGGQRRGKTAGKGQGVQQPGGLEGLRVRGGRSSMWLQPGDVSVWRREGGGSTGRERKGGQSTLCQAGTLTFI